MKGIGQTALSAYTLKTKAAFTFGQQDIRLGELELPEIEPKGILLKIKTCGICGSDSRMYFTGLTPRYIKPVVLGHEFCGHVLEVGRELTGYAIGDLVTVAPIIPCMHCAPCLEGNDNLCENGKVIGTNDHGAMAEYFYIPQQMVLAGGAVKLSPSVEAHTAAMTELVGCCLNGWQQTKMGPGDRIVIFGDGPIGLIFLKLARNLGAGWIGIIGHRNNRMQMASQMGADEVFNFDDLSSPGLFGKRIDRIVLATSNPAILDTAFQMVKPGGSILLFSGYVYGTSYTLDLNKTHYRQIQINTAIDCTIQQFRQSAEMLPGLGLDGLVSKVFPLDEVVAAFEATRDRDVIKTVLEP